MLPETRKKLYLWGLILAAVLGAIFVVWAMFLNRGALKVIAKAPYLVQVKGLKSENCGTDECTIDLAPGDYTVLFQKLGYREITTNIKVPIGGEHLEEPEFVFIPVMSLLGEESSLDFFGEPQNIELPAPFFFEENYATYLARDPETKRQTLYVRGIQGGELGEEKAVTSFTRTLKQYVIAPAIEKQKLIAVVEQTDEDSTLYLVDLEAKTRKNILSYPLITAIKWLPQQSGRRGDFLFEARAEGEIGTSIYLYRSDQEAVLKLDLKTSLTNVVPVSAEKLIAATTQSIVGGEEGINLEGQLVGLGEIEATPNILNSSEITGTIPVGTDEASEVGALPTINLVDYSLLANQARLLKVVPGLGFVEKMKLGADGKSVLLLIQGKVYEFKFED